MSLYTGDSRFHILDLYRMVYFVSLARHAQIGGVSGNKYR